MIHLKSFNDLSNYIKHLAIHTEHPEYNEDSFASLMYKRLKGSYIFSTEAEIDKVCPIRPCLAPMGCVSEELRRDAVAYRINRDFDGHFMAKWLSLIFDNNVIESNHIIYQELSALLQTALSFPSPVRNWEEHRTLFLHSLAVYTSTPLLSYELMRGYLVLVVVITSLVIELLHTFLTLICNFCHEKKLKNAFRVFRLIPKNYKNRKLMQGILLVQISEAFWTLSKIEAALFMGGININYFRGQDQKIIEGTYSNTMPDYVAPISYSKIKIVLNSQIYRTSDLT